LNSETTSPQYWDHTFEEGKESLRLDAWRKYMTSVYSRLTEAWFKQGSNSPILKTDLFEEACTEYSLMGEMGSDGIGFDHSLQIARAAKNKLRTKEATCSVLVCDLRNLPFRTGCLEKILSPSSLDHFSVQQDIDKSLQELGRVLIPGGVLILALDNPHNPVVWVRNHLPFAWLNRVGLVPYYVGPTCTLPQAEAKLQTAGFEVTDCTAVAHVPRAPAIWLVMIAEMLKSKRLGEWLSRGFGWWDVLQRWPLRYRTGYYIALRAVRCRN
jgi:SAM-dependent methyltransferase